MINEEKLKIAANPESFLALASVLINVPKKSLIMLNRFDNLDWEKADSTRDSMDSWGDLSSSMVAYS